MSEQSTFTVTYRFRFPDDQFVDGHSYGEQRLPDHGQAATNAITSLDCFAQIIDFSIGEEMLEDLEQLFDCYLQD